jgi:hypothetical protein
MWLNKLYQPGLGRARKSRTYTPASPQRSVRPRLEQLEDRALLSNFTASTVSDLIADIKAANRAGGTNTITLAANTTFSLTKVDDTTDGATGVPLISAGDALTIVGEGDSIERSSASGTPAFRLFDVASGASLALDNLTLQNGLEDGSGSSAQGGAIYNQGSLTLSSVTVQGNSAVGGSGKNAQNSGQNGGNGQDAAGGGIWSNATLTLENGSLIQKNQALGGNGGNAFLNNRNEGSFNSFGGNGGNASGGGVYIAGGMAKLTGVTFSGNLARGGVGGDGFLVLNTVENPGRGGNAFGGGLSVAGGSVALSSDTLQNNEAQGANIGSGANGSPNPGVGFGGGIFVASAALTLANDTIDSNTSVNPFGGNRGGGIYIGSGTVTFCNDIVESNTAASGYGGGIYIASGATVYIDSFTVANTVNNTDSSGLNRVTANIDGTYILQNC